MSHSIDVTLVDKTQRPKLLTYRSELRELVESASSSRAKRCTELSTTKVKTVTHLLCIGIFPTKRPK